MAEVSHTIKIAAKSDAVQAAAAAVSHLDAKLIAASGAASSAAAAVGAAAARVSELEKTAAKATEAAAKAYAKFGETAEQTLRLSAAASEARDAAEQEAASLDKLRAEAAAATTAEEQLAVAATAAAEAHKAAAAALKEAEADEAADRAADAKLRELENTYRAAEAERKLGDELRRSTGLIKEQEKAIAKQEKAAADEAKQQEKQRAGQSEAVKKQTEHYKTLAKVAAIAAAAALVIVAGLYKAGKAAVLLADKENRLGKLGDHLGDNMKKIFGGLKIGKLLDQFEILADLFHENTAAGRAMKFLFEAIAQPLIDSLAAAIPTIERVFIILLTWAVKAYIALVKFSRTDTFDTIVTGLKVLGVVVGVSLGLFVAFVAIGIALFVALAAAVVYLVGLIWGGLVAAWEGLSGAASAAWGAITSAAQAAVDWLSGLDLMSIGVDMITGLANGILNAGGAVLSAITGVVGGAVDAAVSLLKIGSPSKVFEDIGGYTAEGFAGGVEDGAGDAQAAMSSMVEPPDAAAGAGGAGGAGFTVTVSGNTFVLQGGTTQEQADDFLSKLEGAFRGYSARLGGGEVPA